jgi:Putative transposase/Transposase zinc-binding domain
VIAGELESFLAHRREQGHSIPAFVEREFRAFLDCGVLERGFIRLRCSSCGHDRLVPFSCKRRVWCPSCAGRRMADTAAHLIDHVFPIVPARQWVLSVPFGLRYRMAYDARLTSAVLSVFIRALFGELRRRARELLGIRSSQYGAVTFVQRFGDALNCNVHFHCVATDGVYAAGRDRRPEFHILPAPEDEEVLRLATTVSRRVQSLLERRGLGNQADAVEADPLSETDPGMAAMVANSVRRRVATGSNTGRRVTRLGDQIDGNLLDEFSTPRCATISGFSVHGNVGIDGRDRSRLERLFRYCLRPAVATGRLTILPDGRLLYRLKRPWRDGTAAVIFEPQDFIAKLAVLVPAPRAHLTRFHGVLGPAAAWRPFIVPSAEPHNGAEMDPHMPSPYPIHSPEKPEVGTGQQSSSVHRNYTWADLMKRVFLIDVLRCESCGGRMKIIAAIAAINQPQLAAKILQCTGLLLRAPPPAPASPVWPPIR